METHWTKKKKKGKKNKHLGTSYKLTYPVIKSLKMLQTSTDKQGQY